MTSFSLRLCKALITMGGLLTPFCPSVWHLADKNRPGRLVKTVSRIMRVFQLQLHDLHFKNPNLDVDSGDAGAAQVTKFGSRQNLPFKYIEHRSRTSESESWWSVGKSKDEVGKRWRKVWTEFLTSTDPGSVTGRSRKNVQNETFKRCL